MRWRENPRRVVHHTLWRLNLRLREYHLVDLDPGELDDALYQERLPRRDDAGFSRAWVVGMFAWLAVVIVFGLLFPPIGSALDTIVILILFTGLPLLLLFVVMYAPSRCGPSAIYIHPRDGRLVCYAPDRCVWCPLEALDPAITTGAFRYVGGWGLGSRLMMLDVGKDGHGVWLLLSAGEVRRWVLLERFNAAAPAKASLGSWTRTLGARALREDERRLVPTRVSFSRTAFRRHDKG